MNRNEEKILLTEKETEIIIFLAKSKQPIPIIELQKEVWITSLNRDPYSWNSYLQIKKKNWKKFKDKKLISSMKGDIKSMQKNIYAKELLLINIK